MGRKYDGPYCWDGNRYVALPKDPDKHASLTGEDIAALPTVGPRDDESGVFEYKDDAHEGDED